MYSGKTEKSSCGTGSVPIRASKNPVLGVFLHHCGSIATVHKPKGDKKSHLRYLICDNCGTDQCAGKPYQQKIIDNMYPTIEALEESEKINAEKAAIVVASAEQKTEVNESEVLITGSVVVDQIIEPTETNDIAVSTDLIVDSSIESEITESVVVIEDNLIEPIKPTDTAEIKVTDTISKDEVEPIVQPKETDIDSKVSVEVITPVKEPVNQSASGLEPKVETEVKPNSEPKDEDLSKPKRVGVFAVVGLVIGGVFGLLA